MPKRNKLFFGLIFFYLSSFAVAAVPDPCENNILAIFRRPTVITSACATPYGKYTFESGVEYLEFTNKSKGFMYPQSKVRVGLPGRNELAISFPSEITNTKNASGLSASQLAFKHNIFYTANWNTGIRAVYLPASGSSIYGSAHNGYMLNGTLAYRINSFNASLMLGYSSFSTPSDSGGKRYNTFSPDVALGWQAKEWLQLYAEVYGQLNTGPRKGPGYNTDTGLLFLFTKNIEADIEVGHRITGHLGNFNVYYGTGFSFLF